MPEGSGDDRTAAEVIAGPRVLVAVGVLLVGAISAGLLGFRWTWNRDPLEALWTHPGGWAGAAAFFLGGACVHELLHLIGWKVAGRVPWSALRLKQSRRKLGVIANLRIPAQAGAYRRGLVLPALVVGVAPILAGLLAGVALLTIWGAVFLFESFSDLAILLAIRRISPTAAVLEHPKRLGCMLVGPRRDLDA